MDVPAADPVRTELAHVREAYEIVTAMRAADHLADCASVTTDAATTTRLLVEALDDDHDQLLAIAAVHALSATPGPGAVAELTLRLGDPRWHVSEHAGWALSARPVHRPAVAPLTAAVAEGGFNGMLAQRTLTGWSTGDPPVVAAALLGALDTTDTNGARRRLTETLGMVPEPSVDARLAIIATDPAEALPTRIAATAAIGDRRADRAALLRLVDEPAPLGQHALLALIDLDREPRSTGTQRGPDTDARPGLRVAQLFLHADLEAGPGRAGAGDNGGIATLLWLLSASMADHPDVDEVVTISRGQLADALASTWLGPDEPQRFAGVVFGPEGGVDLRSAWPYRVQIERGLRRIIAGVGRLDAVHLRLADVGTLAAARVARQLDIPMVFTAAPDPHVVIRSLESDGALTRSNFGESDALEHWWFRARMVERLTAHADRLALLPRRDMADDLRDLLGHDLDDDGRSVVIPEGVHAGTVIDAARAVGAARPPVLPSGFAELVAALAALPATRRDMPLIVTVGRLHPAKGIDRVVRAWATHPSLHERANLVVVGGDLDTPSPDELDVLTTIDDVVGVDGGPCRDGLVLLGHRPHGDVARILAAAAGGSRLVPGGGIYVGGARKEEFGLAIVEGLAAGLPVVAPVNGGPATYVRDGVTGVLVDTTSVAALADGMERALGLAATPGRAATATRDVLDHLTIEAMAERLVELYRSAARVVA